MDSVSTAKRPIEEVDNELLKYTQKENEEDAQQAQEPPAKKRRQFQAMTQFSAATQKGDGAGAGQDEPVAGFIKKVVLRNFMSHENFELTLGPKLNFIVGNNGSGKSAILTAITIGLGGKTSDTNRGSKLTDLIREGTHSAKITLHMDNAHHGAYMPEVYGETIIIERNIKRDSTAAFSLKTENGKTISTKKKDVQAVIDYFAIPISNPMCFLSQDAARRFLTASTSQDKYHHFMKGTLLEDTKVNLDKATVVNQNSQENMSLHLDLVRKLKQEYLDAKALAREFNQTNDLNERKNLLQAKSLLVDIRANETSVADLKERINLNNKSVEKANARIESREAKIQKYSSDEQSVEKEIEEQLLVINEKEQKFQEAKQQIRETRDAFEEEKDNEKEVNSNIETCQKKIKLLNDRIAKTEKELEKELGGDREVMKAQLEQLEKEIEAEQSSISALTVQYEDLENEERSTIHQRETEVNSLQQSMNAKRSELSKLKSGNNNFLLNFDRNINKLLEEINRNRGKFQTAPIGPLGNMVSIKSDYKQWAKIIQKYLSTTIGSFVVSNMRDEQLLRNLMRKCNIRGMGVLIYKIKRFDTSRFRINCQYPTVFDALEFDSPDIESLFVDVTYLEKVVLIPDRNEARSFLRGDSGKVRLALALRDHNSGFQLRGGYQLDTISYDSQIKIKMGSSNDDNAEYIAQSIEEDRRELENIKSKYEGSLAEVRQKVSSIKSDIYKVRSGIKEKNKTVTKLTININKVVNTGTLASLKSDKEDQEQALNGYGNAIEELHQKLADMAAKAEPIKHKYDEVRNELNKANQVLKGLKDSVNSRTSRIEQYRSDIKEAEDKKNYHLSQIESINKNIETLMEGIQKQKAYLNQSISVEELEASDLPDDQNILKQELAKVSRDIQRAERSIGISQDKVVELFNASRKKYKDAEASLIQVADALGKLQESIALRLLNYDSFLKFTCLEATKDFRESLRYRKLTGMLVFDNNKSELDMQVSTPNDKTERNVDTLSGGEKSYSQMSLLLATWKPMRSRIIALDEFDVYMDQVNRKVGTGLIVSKLKDNNRTQTIIITPQDIGKITDINDTSVKIHRIKDPKRKNNSTNQN
ncbi:DNA repair protein [Maudiozyma humilis]|uniref:DNA repair protein n=1 Tax=Maudiozyma humilis TaxID=51915 RepID=A0AAV5S0E2_MAUHU|nr:DNA repair protein [Kazachstania humilis]